MVIQSHERSSDGRSIVHQQIVHQGGGGGINQIQLSANANHPQMQASIEHELHQALERIRPENRRPPTAETDQQRRRYNSEHQQQPRDRN